MYPDGPRTRRKRQTTIRCANVTCLLTAGCPHHTKPVTVFHRAVTLRFAITTHKWRLITSRVPKIERGSGCRFASLSIPPHPSLSRLRRRNHVSARARRCCCPFAAKLPQSPQRDGDSPEQRSPAQLTRQSAAARRDTRGRGGQRARARRLSLQDRCRDRCRACAESEVRPDWEKKGASHPEGSSRLRTGGFCEA